MIVEYLWKICWKQKRMNKSVLSVINKNWQNAAKTYTTPPPPPHQKPRHTHSQCWFQGKSRPGRNPNIVERNQSKQGDLPDDVNICLLFPWNVSRGRQHTPPPLHIRLCWLLQPRLWRELNQRLQRSALRLGRVPAASLRFVPVAPLALRHPRLGCLHLCEQQEEPR